MTLAAIIISLICQICLVGGQLLLKHGMNATHRQPKPWRLIVGFVATAIVSLSVYFFLWLGLLQEWELSRLFPFEALSPVLLLFGAWLFLNERVSRHILIGITLILCGVILVAKS